MNKMLPLILCLLLSLLTIGCSTSSKVETGDLTPPKVVNTTLSDEEISKTVSASRVSFNRCYDKQLKKDEQARGRVVVTFVITPNGTVNRAFIKSNDVKDSKDLERCLIDAFLKLQFNSFSGTPIIMEYPIVFELD